MTAYNVVRMRVKPGQDQAFIDLHRTMDPAQHDRMRKNGFRKYAVIKTGERSYCFIGEWDSMDAIVKSRADMIADLDKFRGLLEDLGHGLGVTDPISGEVVAEMGGSMKM
jgi:quinol monooxygenase YgiN